MFRKSQPEALPISRFTIWRHRSCIGQKAYSYSIGVQNLRPIQLRCRQIVNLLIGRASGCDLRNNKGCRFHGVKSTPLVVKIVHRNPMLNDASLTVRLLSHRCIHAQNETAAIISPISIDYRSLGNTYVLRLRHMCIRVAERGIIHRYRVNGCSFIRSVVTY